MAPQKRNQSEYQRGRRAGKLDFKADRTPQFFRTLHDPPLLMLRGSIGVPDREVSSERIDYATGYLEGWDNALSSVVNNEKIWK